MTDQEILDNAPKGATHIDGEHDFCKYGYYFSYTSQRWIKSEFIVGSRSLADIKRIAELEKEREYKQWISVEDRLPDTGRVLAIGDGCESEIVVFLAFAKGGGKFKAKGRDCSDLVTHWMPLPKPQKEQGE